MPGSTTWNNFPYPLPTDPADVPGTTQAFAEDVDDFISQILVPQSRPRIEVRVRGGQTQTVASGYQEPVQFQVEYNDSDNMANLIQSPTTLTVRTSGLYLVHGLISVPSNLLWTQVVINLRKNGTSIATATQSSQSSAQTYFAWTISCVTPCSVGDLLDFTFQHDSGALLILQSGRELNAMRMAS